MFRERLPTASRLCCSRATIPQLQRNLPERERFSRGCKRARLIVLSSPTTPIFISTNRLKDFDVGLAPLGNPEEFVQLRQGLRGGMKMRLYTAKFPKVKLAVITYEMPDGKLEQYQIAVED